MKNLMIQTEDSCFDFIFLSLEYTLHMQAVIRALVMEFFTKMGVSFEMVGFQCQDESAHIYEARIQTPDSKILIGVHGQTLDHIKHLLSRMGEKAIGNRCTIHIEVNDYLKSKDERLYLYIDSKIAEVQNTKTSIVLNQLTSYERKKVHDYVRAKNISGIEAHSEGEGSERRLHLIFKPTSNTLSISEDGVGI